MRYLIFPALLAANTAFAETCPPVMDIADDVALLLDKVQAAPNEGAARVFSDAVWELWIKAPDDKAQALLDRGMERLRVSDYDEAELVLTELVTYCPAFAEGYNQRAFVNYLRRDFEPALVDLDRTIELSPNHVAAIAGKSLTLMGLGRPQLAQKTLREALALNPWLSERALLVEPAGEEL